MSDDPNARNTDPDTSKESGADIRRRTAADRTKVYKTFFENHPTPLADFQLEELLGGALNGKWRKRRSDLKDDRVLIRIDKIVNPKSGKEVIRWGLRNQKDKPEVQLQELEQLSLFGKAGQKMQAPSHSGRHSERMSPDGDIWRDSTTLWQT